MEFWDSCRLYVINEKDKEKNILSILFRSILLKLWTLISSYLHI